MRANYGLIGIIKKILKILFVYVVEILTTNNVYNYFWRSSITIGKIFS